MENPSPQKQSVAQQEIIIDIHMKHLKLKVEGKTPLRVIWSRGKKQAKTQVKILNDKLDVAVFDEKFQINTVLELDKETQMPIKEKLSKMSVCLDKSLGGKQLGEVEFNMADFNYGSYKSLRLNLNQVKENTEYNFDSSETYIDIGLKGTKADGLVQKRMSAIKGQMNDSLKDLLKGQSSGGKKGADQLKAVLQGSQSQELMQNIINIEVDKLKKDAKEKKKEYEKKLAEKTNKINDLLTELENTKTEVFHHTGDKQSLESDKGQLNDKFIEMTNQLKSDQSRQEILQNKIEVQTDNMTKKDTIIEELSQEVPNGNEDSKARRQLEKIYNFDRFEVNFNRDVETYLLIN